MHLTNIGGTKRPPRKRRLAGALAAFGAGDEMMWRIIGLGLKILELPEKLKHGLPGPNPPAVVPVHPRHEHL